MSVSAGPMNAPFSEIWITRESMVASTVPSTTSVSPVGDLRCAHELDVGATVSLLPRLSPTEEACGYCPVNRPLARHRGRSQGERCSNPAGVVWRWKVRVRVCQRRGFARPSDLRKDYARGFMPAKLPSSAKAVTKQFVGCMHGKACRIH